MPDNYKNLVVLSSTNAYTTTETFALHNPTASEIEATVIGSVRTYQSDAYKDLTTGVSIKVQPGGTLYGRFSSVVGGGLVAYY